MQEYIKVGKVKDAHGLKGELYILLFAKEATWIKNLKSFYLSRETATGQIETKEFNLKSAKPHKDGLIVSSPDITDRNQSEALKGFGFEIPKSILVSKKGDTPYLIEVLGFEVFENGSKIGFVQDFATNNHQDLLVVESDSHFYEIPFVEAFVENVDYSLKQINVQLPEGLLELCGHAK